MSSPQGTPLKRYYEQYWSRASPPPCDDPLFPTRLRLLRERLSAAGARTVLDAGSGAGGLVAELSSLGFAASGLEVSERAVRRARERHPDCSFLVHDLETLPWPVEPGSVDVVCSFEVIEHLLSPRSLLEGAHAALKPGGRLALTTPYHGLLKNLALVLSAFDRHFAVEGDHIRFFSDRSLRALLEETGFRDVSFQHFGRGPGLWAGTFAWARRP